MDTQLSDQPASLGEVVLRFGDHRGVITAGGIPAWIFLGMASVWAVTDDRFILAIALYLLAWSILGGSLALHVLVVRRLRRSLVADEFKLCLQCRHPLRGLAAVGSCPECGENFDIQVVCTTWRQLVHLPESGSSNDYWVRQFTMPATRRQRVFDVMFGLVMPIVCMIFDPIVFKGGLPLDAGEGMLGELRWFAYAGLGVEIVTLGAWLQYGDRLGRWREVLGGIMIGGSVIAAMIAITIFPVSLIGILAILIGTLGFTPFLTSLVLARNATRALAQREDASPLSARRLRMGLGILILLTAAIAAHATQHEGDFESMILIDLDDHNPADNW